MSGRIKNPKIVISGYYGYDNCGDEAVLLSILHCLRKLKSDLRITVLSGNPKKTAAHYGVCAISRWSLPAIIRELSTATLLISGGGSLIQDVTSVRSPGYYLGIIRLALMLRKRVMIYSQGIGPLTNESNRANTAKVFSRCNAITLRDAGSAELLKEIGVKKELLVACDPVLALSRGDVSDNMMGKLLDEFGIAAAENKPRKPLLFVSIRTWNNNPHFMPVAKFLDDQIESGWDVILVPAHFPDDVAAGKAIVMLMSTKPYEIDRALSAEEFIALTAAADSVLSMRLHGLICASAVGTPIFGLSYDPKVAAFMKQCGHEESCLSYDDPDLGNKVHMAYAGHHLSKKSLDESPAIDSRLNDLAWESARIAVDLLK